MRKEIVLKSIDRIFKILAPKDPLDEKYLFRGQVGEYPLVPSALRDGFIKEWEPMFIDDPKERNKRGYFHIGAKKDWNQNKNDTGRFKPIAKQLKLEWPIKMRKSQNKTIHYLEDEAWQKYIEFRVLNRFVRLLDDAGIPFPGDDSIFRTLLYSLRMNHYSEAELERDIYEVFKSWKPYAGGVQERIPWVSLITLARHLELPTRLLDWTIYSFNALYFAASSAIMQYKEKKKKEDLFVYQLDLRKANQQGGNSFYLYDVPGTLNANLAAQKGRLTWMDHKSSLEARKGYGEMREFRGAILKYRIPFKLSVEILIRLKKNFVSRDVLFPGLHEKVRHMKETATYSKIGKYI